MTLPAGRAVISFTFDDFPRTAWRVGGPILSEHAIRATYYTALGLTGEVGQLGQLHEWDDLAGVQGAGHEIACHTHDHLLATSTPVPAFSENCQRNRETAEQRLGITMRNFAYPQGKLELDHKRGMERDYRSLRGIYHGINRRVLDLNLLYANPLYERFPLSDYLSLIQDVQANAGWLIFYTHDIQSNPSHFGCSPTRLREVLRRSVESGVAVLPIDAALDYFQGRPQVGS